MFSRLINRKTIYCQTIVELILVTDNEFLDIIGYAMFSPVALKPGDMVYYGHSNKGEGVYAVLRGGEYIYKQDGFDPKRYNVETV